MFINARACFCWFDAQSWGLYLVWDEILTHGQCHLNGVGLVRDGDRVHLKLVFAVDVVGLGHRVLEHLFVALLAQHGADVDDLGLAAAPCTWAGHEESKENQTHVCPSRDPRGSASCHAAGPSMRQLNRPGLLMKNLLSTGMRSHWSYLFRYVCVFSVSFWWSVNAVLKTSWKIRVLEWWRSCWYFPQRFIHSFYKQTRIKQIKNIYDWEKSALVNSL